MHTTLLDLLFWVFQALLQNPITNDWNLLTSFIHFLPPLPSFFLPLSVLIFLLFFLLYHSWSWWLTNPGLGFGEKACIIQFTDEMGQHLESAWYTHCTYLTAPAVYLTSQVKFLHLVLLSWKLLMFIKWIQSTGKNPVLNAGGDPNPYPPR